MKFIRDIASNKAAKHCKQLAISLVAISLAGCGSQGSKKQPPKNLERNPNALVRLTFNLSQSNPDETSIPGFALAPAADYSASISGCKTGFQRSGITAATSDLFVQKNDTDCVFKLDTLTFAGENFSFQLQNQWGSGTSFDVTGSAGTVIRFAVISNIQSRITEDQTISMNFSYAAQGTPTEIGARVGVAVSIVGADPILLEVSQLDVTVMADGAGQFNAILNCSTPVATGRCGSIQLNALRFGLAANAENTLSLGECRAIALGAAHKLKGTELPVGTPSAANGGISVARLKGPTPLYGTGNDKLYLAATDTSSSYGSCKYYRILVRSSF
jgi:hypothetical protein